MPYAEIKIPAVNPSRVLIVSSEFPPGPGGIGRHAADLSKALADKGCIVDVYSSNDYVGGEALNNYRNELPGQIRLHHFKRVGLLTYPIRILRVLKAVRRSDYGRLVFTGKFPLWIGGVVKTFYGEKGVIEFFVHGSEINPCNKFSRVLTHWSLDKADRIWAVSEFTKSLLPENVRGNKEIHILPNGVHVSDWPFSDSLEPYNDWKGYPKLLTVGSISPRKGQHRVINALPQLKKKYPQIHYHIVGMDTNSEYLRDIIRTLKLGDHVTLHGRFPGKNELAKAYRTIDIFMMLSENQPDGDVEGFGISILEANLYGKPAIGSRGCGIEDAIKPGINGELVDGNNHSEISEAITNILNRKEQYNYGTIEWVSRHNWNVLINDFLKAK